MRCGKEGARFLDAAQQSGRRKGLEEPSSVGPPGEPWVEYRDNPAVLRVPDEPTEPLFEGERGLGNLEGVEGILPLGTQPIDAGLNKWLLGGGQGQLVDH